MVLGFNHNIMYRGEVFHVQTEDSGVEIPNIVTLLYKGGVILCSMKTSYADILKMENLEDVVEELMKEQHKAVMRRLKSGEFDERAFPVEPDSGGEPAAEEPPPLAAPDSPTSEEPSAPVGGAEQSPDGAAGGEGGTIGASRSLNDEILRFFGILET
jgi:hypothetical protein